MAPSVWQVDKGGSIGFRNTPDLKDAADPATVCMCVCARACVWLCVCVRARARCVSSLVLAASQRATLV